MTAHGDLQRIEAELKLILSGSLYDQDELIGSLARYACVLASSYVEAAVRDLIRQYCETRAAPTVRRYVESHQQYFRNPNTEKILQVLGSFDPELRSRLESSITDEQKSAVDSIAAHRNSIAHGRRSGISLGQAKQYHDRATAMLTHVRGEMLP